MPRFEKPRPGEPIAHKAIREKFIKDYIEMHHSANVLDSELVDKFVEATNAPIRITYWGANKCPTLGQDLARLASCGTLRRYRFGLAGNWQPGFPTWIWDYCI